MKKKINKYISEKQKECGVVLTKLLYVSQYNSLLKTQKCITSFGLGYTIGSNKKQK